MNGRKQHFTKVRHFFAVARFKRAWSCPASLTKMSLLFLLHLFLLQGCEDMSMRFDNDPKGNFEALWTIIDRNYCFFEYKEIDWNAVYSDYSARVTPDM